MVEEESRRTFKQFPMIDRHSHDATDEAEILDVFFVEDTRIRIDLQRIVVATRRKDLVTFTPETFERLHSTVFE